MRIKGCSEVEIPIKHNKLDKAQSYTLAMKNKWCHKGDILLKSNEDGHIPSIKIKNLMDKDFTVQVGQLLGYFSIVSNSAYNKDII